MDMKISDSSLTLLNACATIILYEGADRVTVMANIEEIADALDCVMNIDHRDVEPYLVEPLLEMQQELLELKGEYLTQNAHYGGGTWPKV